MRLVRVHGYSQAETARNLDINVNMWGRWILKYKIDESQAFRSDGKFTPEQEELRRQRVENRQLKLECETLQNSLLHEKAGPRYQFIAQERPTRYNCFSACRA